MRLACFVLGLVGGWWLGVLSCWLWLHQRKQVVTRTDAKGVSQVRFVCRKSPAKMLCDGRLKDGTCGRGGYCVFIGTNVLEK